MPIYKEEKKTSNKCLPFQVKTLENQSKTKANVSKMKQISIGIEIHENANRK